MYTPVAIINYETKIKKPIYYNQQKNRLLKGTLGICFEDIVNLINTGRTYKIIRHNNYEKYPNQKIIVISVNKYIHLVPFIEEDSYIFLKTVFASKQFNSICNYLNNEY